MIGAKSCGLLRIPFAIPSAFGAPQSPSLEVTLFQTPAIDILMFKSLKFPEAGCRLHQQLRIRENAAANTRPVKPRHFRFFASLLPLLALIGSPLPARGADPTVEINPPDDSVSATDTAANWVRSFPRVEIYTQFHSGYDDNFLTRSPAVGAWFTNEQITLSYQMPSRTTQLSIVTGGGAVNYLGQRTDANGFFDLSLSHRFTPRLTLNASLDAAYLSEPNLNANVGTNQFSGSYFNTNDKIWASYELTRRLSLVSSYSLLLVRYENQATAAFTDRQENTFGEQLRFELTRTTVLTGAYSILLTNYVTAPLDSTTQFFLAGIEHRFSRRLNAQFQAGASILSYNGTGGSQTNPNFQGSLKYALGRRSALSWTGSYSVEQPQQQGVAAQKALRTSLQLSHAFTGRISSSLSFGYSHQDNQQGTSFATIGSSFTEDIFDASLSFRYRLNSRVAFDASYDRSDVSSPQPGQSYSRNRYSIGASLTF